MNKTLVLVVFFSAVIFANSSVFACAGCLDLVPEVIVMDADMTDAIIATNPELKQEALTLSSVSCTRQNAFFGGPQEASCTFSGMAYMGLDTSSVYVEGEVASVLYYKLKNMTVEVASQLDSEDSAADEFESQRTGERVKITLLNQSTQSSTISIPAILLGKLSCPVVNGKNRCELEVSSVGVGLLYAQ